ncbi:hypothetical protein L6164_021763 [Bauhinia variegata]|uniref:Uncharacterized protein n=1 Tax=Bauhinia variegata TaxID=167791 RepID=A0ACB9MDG0_BAUVA|nr:hypothetical protein L6164_021763 [Bauhinia variegata]
MDGEHLGSEVATGYHKIKGTGCKTSSTSTTTILSSLSPTCIYLGSLNKLCVCLKMASSLFNILINSSKLSRTRSFGAVSTQISNHTAKWMQDTSKKSPMELINEVPPIKVEGRIVACEGDTNPALGHPIEFICLDLAEPAVCKYCGLRYVQDHHH